MRARSSKPSRETLPRVGAVSGTLLSRWCLTLATLMAWLIVTETGLVSELYLPGPRSVLEAVHEIGLIKLLLHALATAFNVLLGLALGVLSGFALGLGVSVSPRLLGVVERSLEAIRPVPPVATVPFLLLWFGFSQVGRVLLVASGIALQITVATLEAARNLRPVWLQAAGLYGARGKALAWRVVAPGVLPDLVGPVRVSVATAVSLQVVSELLGSQVGLGYLINVSRVTFGTERILLATILLGIIAGSIDLAARKLVGVATVWADRSAVV